MSASGPSSTRGDLWLVILAATGVLLSSIVFNEYGMLHFEWWERYVSFHLGPGSIWAKIFDSRTLDQGVYAGREFSYLVDHLDMLALAWSVRIGAPFFVSWVHLVLAGCIGVWLARFCARDLGLGSLVGLLMALLFWTAPSIYIHFFMRTAKSLTAAGAVMLLIAIYRACAGINASARLSWRSAGVIGLSAFVMCFADRQGFYLLLCALAGLALEWLVNRHRVVRDVLVLLAVIVVVELVYFLWLAPWLTQSLWGYPPDFSFNRLPLTELMDAPARFMLSGAELLLQTIGFTLGGMPLWMVIVLLAVVVGLRAVADRHRQGHVPVTVFLVGLLAGLWVMNMLMVLRHPPLLWPDVRIVYYWIPATALTMLGLGIGVSAWVRGHRWRKTGLAGLLLVLLLGNIRSLPARRQVYASGHLQPSIEASGQMRLALQHRGNPDYDPPKNIARLDALRTLMAQAPLDPTPAASSGWSGLDEFYRRTRGPGAPLHFVPEFGGSVDSRFLLTTANLSHLTDGRGIIGLKAGRVEMRVDVPANRLQIEMIVQRIGPDASRPVFADFTAYAQPNSDREPRFERWRGRVELPAGRQIVTQTQVIDSSGLPSLLTVQLPPEAAGQVLAGWRNPQITHVARDNALPQWFFDSGPVVTLGGRELDCLLPAGWRPAQALMRNGRLTDAGLVLEPGGEIWLRVDDSVTGLAGEVTAVAAWGAAQPPLVYGLWYRGGRLEIYSHEAVREGNRSADFKIYCAEPGGWLVIAMERHQDTPAVLVNVNSVTRK